MGQTIPFDACPFCGRDFDSLGTYPPTHLERCAEFQGALDS